MLLVLSFMFLVLFITPCWAGTSYYWTGAGQTFLWSDKNNWIPIGVPGQNDNAGFGLNIGANPNKDCLIDSAISINSLIILNKYTGTISLAAYLEVKGVFKQANGTFNETSDTSNPIPQNFAKIAVLGNYTVTVNATFNGPSKATYASKAKGSTVAAVRIASKEDLMTVCDNLDKNYVQTEDISFGPFPKNFADYDGKNFIIGNGSTSFRGTYNGYGYIINNLYIDSPDQNGVGLFGSVSAENDGEKIIKNIRLMGPKSSITGSYHVGGLVGYNYKYSIINCYTEANVTGEENIGGLVGYSAGLVLSSCAAGEVKGTGRAVGGLIGRGKGPISGSCATGKVTGVDYVGGLVGGNEYSPIIHSYATGDVTGNNYVGGLAGGWLGCNYGASIKNSYATGVVKGRAAVGGLVGENGNTIYNCYATGDVISTIGVAGGLVGRITADRGSVHNSYSTGDVFGSQRIGGLVGDSSNTLIANSYSTGNVSLRDVQFSGGLVGYCGKSCVINNCAWWTGSATNAIGHDENQGNMAVKYLSTYKYGTDNKDVTAVAFFSISNKVYKNYSYGGRPWDFNNIWVMPNNGYPMLRFRYSTSIKDIYQLQLVIINPSAAYVIVNDIDALETQNWNWDGKKHLGFSPVSNFAGSLDGRNFTISNLSINRPAQYYAGLFANATSSASIKNLKLTTESVTGVGWVGGLVGLNRGKVDNVTLSKNNIKGSSFYVGGIAGANPGIISNSSVSDSTITGIAKAATNAIAIGGTQTNCKSTNNKVTP